VGRVVRVRVVRVRVRVRHRVRVGSYVFADEATLSVVC
jgi:hypothetical protein